MSTPAARQARLRFYAGLITIAERAFRPALAADPATAVAVDTAGHTPRPIYN
jgi:hypothetical protein